MFSNEQDILEPLFCNLELSSYVSTVCVRASKMRNQDDRPRSSRYLECRTVNPNSAKRTRSRKVTFSRGMGQINTDMSRAPKARAKKNSTKFTFFKQKNSLKALILGEIYPIVTHGLTPPPTIVTLLRCQK